MNLPKRQVYVIAHDIRSTHNIGSLIRTCEGLGVARLYLTGYTPYPETKDDERLPHIRAKLSKQINKTALGAEFTLDWQHQTDVTDLLKQLTAEGFCIVALDQTPDAINLLDYQPPEKLALVLGREIGGLNDELLKYSDAQVLIPMAGKKDSFNVVQAAAMALFYFKYLGRST